MKKKKTCSICGSVGENYREYDGEFFCKNCFNEEFFVCDCCEKTYPKTDGLETASEMVCQNCFDEYYTTCKKCGDVVHCDDVNNINTSDDTVELWCADCISEYAFTCVYCGNLYPSMMSLRIHNNDLICDYCYDGDFFTCDDCGEIYNNDDYGRDGLCCNCSLHKAAAGIHDYHHRPILNFHRHATEKAGKKNIYSGIELEVEGDSDLAVDLLEFSEDEQIFWCEHDGSLDNGFEIVFHPRTLSSWQNYELDKICKFLIDNDFSSHNTSTCGLHVHIARKHLTKSQEIKLGLFMGFNAEQLKIFGRRDYNGYCKQKFIDDKRDAGYSSERYEAINFKNKYTIEFRFFRGTLKRETILASIEFVNALTSFAGKFPFLIFCKRCWDNFMEFAKDNVKIYPHLVAYCKEKSLM